jgi:DNA-binding MarR family transcriptional regulator
MRLRSVAWEYSFHRDHPQQRLDVWPALKQAADDFQTRWLELRQAAMRHPEHFPPDSLERLHGDVSAFISSIFEADRPRLPRIPAGKHTLEAMLAETQMQNQRDAELRRAYGDLRQRLRHFEEREALLSELSETGKQPADGALAALPKPSLTILGALVDRKSLATVADLAAETGLDEKTVKDHRKLLLLSGEIETLPGKTKSGVRITNKGRAYLRTNSPKATP